MSSTALARKAQFSALWPGVVAALSFSSVDILIKVVFASGMDVMTMIALRGLIVLPVMYVWLRTRPPVLEHTRRQRWIAWAIGLLFTGTRSGLFMAISLLPVSIAILAYFAYPLLTGIGGGITGVDRLGWPALLTALAAFVGLSLMLGAEYSNLSSLGIFWALVAAVLRMVSLLMTRAYLNGTDARVTTWYSMLPSTMLFVIAVVVSGNWHVPNSGLGWSAFLASGVCSLPVAVAGLCIDQPRWSVPHCVHHEPGTVGDNPAEPFVAAGDTDANPVDGGGGDADVAGGVSTCATR